MTQENELLNSLNLKKEIFETIEREVSDISDLKEKIKNSLPKDITEILNIIFSGIIKLRASDLHIEPAKNTTKLRLRLDGILHDLIEINHEIYENLLSRIKILARIKLNITKKPQDGRFTILLPTKSIQIEVRVSTLPAEYGESVVMRILNPKSLISLKELGLRNDLLKIFQNEIKKPNGMIIVTGPTGSGKTTTLYAFLKEITKPEIKIITIEDPIEYHLEGISQTQVDPLSGYNFANGLRSIVRQDPDVILVGEIRDAETAKIAIQASLTGHLVLSTLHTNDAVGTIDRLLNFGIDQEMISSALNIIIAQRLVRKVCPKCTLFRKITEEEKEHFKKDFQILKNKEIIPPLDGAEIPIIKGCKFCNFTGYRGRIGIFEAIKLSENIKKLILNKEPVFSIEKQAIKEGMVPMYQDGLIKVLNKKTSLEELERVVSEN